jgi:hypothetical protein
MAFYDLKCISSRSGEVDMIRKILSSIAVLSGFLLLANALPSEMMEDRSLDLLDGYSRETQKEIDADNSLEDVNITGVWYMDLTGEPREKMKLYLLQNGSQISGQGAVIRRDETLKATACGSVKQRTPQQAAGYSFKNKSPCHQDQWNNWRSLPQSDDDYFHGGQGNR